MFSLNHYSFVVSVGFLWRKKKQANALINNMFLKLINFFFVWIVIYANSNHFMNEKKNDNKVSSQDSFSIVSVSNLDFDQLPTSKLSKYRLIIIFLFIKNARSKQEMSKNSYTTSFTNRHLRHVKYLNLEARKFHLFIICQTIM